MRYSGHERARGNHGDAPAADNKADEVSRPGGRCVIRAKAIIEIASLRRGEDGVKFLTTCVYSAFMQNLPRAANL